MRSFASAAFHGVAAAKLRHGAVCGDWGRRGAVRRYANERTGRLHREHLGMLVCNLLPNTSMDDQVRTLNPLLVVCAPPATHDLFQRATSLALGREYHTYPRCGSCDW